VYYKKNNSPKMSQIKRTTQNNRQKVIRTPSGEKYH
jgi:hypothetical protein